MHCIGDPLPNPNRLVSVGKIDFSRNKNTAKAINNQISKKSFTDIILDKDNTLWIIWR